MITGFNLISPQFVLHLICFKCQLRIVGIGFTIPTKVTVKARISQETQAELWLSKE